MQLDERRCFGTGPGTGNPALVIQGGPPDAAARQAFARQARRPACVFLTDLGDGQFEADYVYPHMRSPLCLHATLAAAEVLFEQYGHVALRTAMHGQELPLERDGATFYVGVARQPAPGLALEAELLATLLGAPGLVPERAPAVVSVGSPKLLIEVASPEVLHGLAPPLEHILAWSKSNGVNGCYVYCRVGEHSFEGRNFNHAEPDLEDSATGVAAGALSAYLGSALTLFQGKSRGNHCRLETRMYGATILVGGNVSR